MAEPTSTPYWQSERFKDELRLIQLRRAGLKPKDQKPDKERAWGASFDPDQPIGTENNSPHNARLFGLAFSGGGIRSATFCLGVIQVLAGKHLLRRVDYLSTVSGGGYIGSWLTALLSRRGKTSNDDGLALWSGLEEELKPSAARSGGDARGKTRKPSGAPPAAQEAAEVSWLRDYSNYLSPNPAVFSADFWSMIMIWFRNTLLNLLMLAGLFGSALLLPRLAAALLFDRHPSKSSSVDAPWWPLILAGAIFAFLLLWLCRRLFSAIDDPAKGLREFEAAIWSAVLCCGATLLASFWFLAGSRLGWPYLLAASFIVVFVLVWLSTRIRDPKSPPSPSDPQPSPASNRFKPIVALWAARIGAALVASAIFTASVRYLSGVVAGWNLAPGGGLRAATLAPSAILALFTLAIILMIGIAGRRMDDRLREWWSRLGAWIALVAFSLLAASAISFYGPLALMKLSRGWQLNVGTGWLLTGLASLAGGWSEKSGGKGSPKWLDRSLAVLPHLFVLGILLAAAGVVDQIAHLQRAWCPWPGIEASASRCQSAPGWTPGVWPTVQKLNPWDAQDEGLYRLPLLTGKVSRETALSFAYFSRIEEQYPSQLLAFLLAAMVICALFTWRIDINEFSMHSFYRNRLVRAYLGASRSREREQNADSFTSLDGDDDLPLHSLYTEPTAKTNAPGNADSPPETGPPPETKPPAGTGQNHWGPYPIINTAINLASGERGQQERRAACFAFTPRWTGYTLDRERKVYYGETAGLMSSAGGLKLGTAVAISGAAASPNMGFHTVPALAFLMTLFNVRLGWWTPNPAPLPRDWTPVPFTGWLSRLLAGLKSPAAIPKLLSDFRRHRKDSGALSRWKLSGPRAGLFPMIAELAGLADDEGRFVYLSDGGHFENLAVYELLRRRCRFIVCCDAEEDAALSFESLGGLVRKAREDFGIEITIDTTPISLRDPRGFSKASCVVGVIRYPETESSATLLYLKSSVTGDEPADVLEYMRSHPQFPHQTTADQFFSESQFESYRRLGEHVATRALEPAMDSSGRLPAEESGDSVDLSPVFLELRRAWQFPSLEEPPAAPHAWGARLEELDRRLRDDPLLAFLNPQFHSEWRQLCPAPDQPWWPLPEKQFAAAFHYCVDILRLMQEVHAGLDLERRSNHPDCRGWMNQFMHWAGSDMLQLSYTLAGANLSGRFQSYARRFLDLKLSGVAIGSAPPRFNDFELDLHKRLRDWADAHQAAGIPGSGKLEFLPIVLPFEPLFPERMLPPSIKKESLALTVGFVALFPAAAGHPQLLYWIRIRNHLRRLGLGRQALHKLIESNPKLAVVRLDHFLPGPERLWEYYTPWFHEWARRYLPLFIPPAQMEGGASEQPPK